MWPWHSESLRPSDMGSVQNLIGMPSNGYVPKVAVQNTITIYNFFFKKNIWAKYWWRILCFNHSIHKWFKNIYSTILPCQVCETFHWCMLWLWIRDISALLWAAFLRAVFHSSETHYDLGCRDICQMAMSTHISRFWQKHFLKLKSRFLAALFLQYYY